MDKDLFANIWKKSFSLAVSILGNDCRLNGRYLMFC